MELTPEVTRKFNLDHGQEKMGVFEKKSGNLTKLKKKVRLIYKIPYFPKPSNSKKLIKNPLKSD